MNNTTLQPTLILPGTRRVAVLANPGNESMNVWRQDLPAAAAKLNVELFVRNAWMIDRIFNGTRPADIPVEQPTRFRLDVNLTTAKPMGLTLPRSLLARG